ncbi:Ferric reductase transmembrane component-like domain protein [Kalmanozyma brasiliensis GHG001]|uniref:FAD-binding FR-type domain-containing protein n=1 Tax=Kalmanozyma brasiliensis (strain GHG001) TaxID=1365824 RepID=V5F1C8_KALBG|nr:Ferric reductase transmembrane component-like domain protein [Kalmanozyma brasiliensis GHG001]EST09089.1 Ferric reductase transmembrane component-like domain protein [Kalmanozyma brasiliensis GHG001]
MISKPWELGAEAWEYIDSFPAEQQPAAILTYQRFNYNSYKVPCIASFVLYGLFLLLVLAASLNNVLAWVCPTTHSSMKQKSRLVRAHIWEHPLITQKHATVVSFPFLRWLTLQLPLRGEAFIIFAFSMVNFVPLVAFYDLLLGDQQIFYPGPTSKRDQIQRHLADRTGILGTAQLPLLIMMASKRTPLAIVSGLGMDRLMLYHRWISRWFWAHIFIHTVVWTVVYAQSEGVAVMLADTYVKWGCVGFSAMCALVFLSLRSLRQRFYEAFVMIHIVMALLAIVGTYLHIKLADASEFDIFRVMTEIAAVLWAFDRLVRWIGRIYLSFSSPRLTSKNDSSLVKCASGRIQSFGTSAEYAMLRISVPASKIRLAHQPRFIGGIAAGDDIRITVPRLQWVGEHPFTVFNVGTTGQDATHGYIDLLVKAEAGLTRKIARHTSTANEGDEKDVELAGVKKGNSDVAVLIEGPFGKIPEIPAATTDLVLVAGGIAITFCWPIFVSAFEAAKTGKLQNCKLIWIVRKQSTLSLLEEAFADLLTKMQDGKSDRCRFTMDIYVTSTGESTQMSSLTDSDSPIKEKSSTASISAGHESDPSADMSDDVELPQLPKSQNEASMPSVVFDDRANGDLIQVSHFSGRPAPLASALFSHLEEAELQGNQGSLTVALCGPPTLCDDVRFEAVRLLKRGINLELIEDCFTW